jgi:hypothetical protein
MKSLADFLPEIGIQPKKKTLHEQNSTGEWLLLPGSVIAVGFGEAYLELNGQTIWREQDVKNPIGWESFLTCRQAESLAASNPEGDWRIHLVGPLYEVHYQRQSSNRWVLYSEGAGFA